MSENSILDELIYDRSSGSLLYQGVRYLLIRPETIAGFQKALFEKYGKEAEESLFKGGFNGGSLSARKCKELYKFSDLEVCEIGSWRTFDSDKSFEAIEPHVGSFQITVRCARAKSCAPKARRKHDAERKVPVQRTKA